MIVIAVLDKPIGIDVEKLRKPDMHTANRFFTKREVAYISECNDEQEQNKRFFEIWTRKEAYYKCLGTGIRMPMDSFDVTLPSSNYKTTIMGDYVVSTYQENLCCNQSV